MASTILQICQDAVDDGAMSFGRPSTLFPTDDNGDATPRKLVRALTRTAQAIAARYEWQSLKKEYTFTTVAAEIQPSGLPSDLLRVVPDTMWVAGLLFQGPVNDADWAAMRAGRLPQAWPAFRIYGDALHLWPVPGVNQSVTYQYISNAVGKAADTTARTRFAADTDTTLWDDELMTLGLVAALRQSERLDYAQDMADFETCLANRIKADGGSRILSMRTSKRTLKKPVVTLVTNDGTRWGGSDW